MLFSYNDIKNISPFTLPFAQSEPTGQPLCLGNTFYMNNQQEIWKDIIGWEMEYEISNQCRVRRVLQDGEYEYLLFPRKYYFLKGRENPFYIHTYKTMLQVFPELKQKVESIDGELWMDIHGYEGLYQVSTKGRVKSLSYKNTGDEKLFVEKLDTRGYVQVMLTKDKLNRTYLLHRLVAQAFISNPENKPQINHINGIRTDNRLENLEWVTNRENCSHGAKLRGEKTSAYTGVSWCKIKNKWVSRIELDGKGKSLGYFTNQETAREAYLKALSENGIENKYATNQSV